MAQQVKSLAYKPHSLSRRAQTPKSCPLTSTMHCGMCAHTDTQACMCAHTVITCSKYYWHPAAPLCLFHLWLVSPWKQSRHRVE